MKTLTKIGIVTASIACATLTLTAAVIGNNGKAFTDVAADVSKSVTITSEMLAGIPLTDLILTGTKKDKAFTITLDGGNYIYGALLFNDCDYQFAGTTLGAAFGIDNTDSKANAYNFNILFSFKSTSEATFDFTVSSDAVGYGFSCYSKCGYINGADFYNNLKTKDYAKLVAKPVQWETGNMWENWGSNDGVYGENPSSTSVTCPGYTYTVAAFQFIYRGEYLPAGRSVSCTLNSIFFRYNC